MKPNEIIDIFRQKWLGQAKDYLHNQQKLNDLLDKSHGLLDNTAVRSIVEEVRTLIDFVRDVTTGKYKDYSAKSMLLAVAALIYVVSPADAMPDFLPLIGFTDDIAVVGFVIKQLHDELLRYRQSKS